MSAAAPGSLFDFGKRVGILLIAEAAGLSAVAVAGLLFYIAFSGVAFRPRAARRWQIDSALHIYLLNLLVCDLIQASGGLMNIRWIVEAEVTASTYCTAQGAVKQLGDIGTSAASLIIAVHTFTTLVFGWNALSSARSGICVVFIVWVILVVVIVADIASNGASTFYGPTGYWCWISPAFPVQRMAVDYVWLFIAALFNIVAYVPLYLVLQGVIAFGGWKIYRPKSSNPRALHHSNSVALKMLIYPAVFTFTVLPIAIVRWITFTQDDMPFAATIVADVIYVSSGLFNVVLYSLTRPFLLPQRRSRTRRPEETVISFSHTPRQVTQPTTYDLGSLYSLPNRSQGGVGAAGNAGSAYPSSARIITTRTGASSTQRLPYDDPPPMPHTPTATFDDTLAESRPSQHEARLSDRWNKSSSWYGEAV